MRDNPRSGAGRAKGERVGDDVRGDLPWGPVVPPGPTRAAAQHPRTRAWLRRWVTFGLAFTLLGAALAPVAWSAFSSRSTRCEHFLLPEYLTLGVVTSVSSTTFRQALDVRLEESTRVVTLDVAAPDSYDVGEDVLLVGSGDDWFVLPCSDNQSISALWLASAVVVLLGAGLPVLGHTLLMRRRLVREPWREVTAYVGSSARWWEPGRTWHVRIDGTYARVLSGVQPVQDAAFAPEVSAVRPVDEPARTVRLWVAGPLEGRRVPVAAPGGRSVLALRVASSEFQRREWAEVVDPTD